MVLLRRIELRFLTYQVSVLPLNYGSIILSLNSYMNYYKYLDLNWETAAAKIRNFIEQREELIFTQKGAWIAAPSNIIKEIPEIEEMFLPLKLDINEVGFFITRYRVGSIHTDGTPIPIRINFPILNCENTETRYYQVNGNSLSLKQPNGNKYIQYQPEHCNFVDSFKLTKPVVMRVLEPHQVISYSNNLPRISCTISFKQDINYLLS